MGQIEQDFVNSVINEASNVPENYDVADFPSTVYTSSASGMTDAKSIDSGIRQNAEFEQAIYDSYSQKASQAQQAIATSQELANVEIGKALAQAQMENLGKRQKVYDEMTETLTGREEVLAYPEIVRDFASLFNAKMSKKYYDEKLATQSARLDVLKNQSANDLEEARQAANAITGYNPLANEPLDKVGEWEKQYVSQIDALQKNAIAANKIKFDRENIPLELAKLSQKNRSDKIDLATALINAKAKKYTADVSRLNAIGVAGTEDLNRESKERIAAQVSLDKNREIAAKEVANELKSDANAVSLFNAFTNAENAGIASRANDLKEDQLKFNKDELKFKREQEAEDTRQFNIKAEQGYFSKNAEGIKPDNVADSLASNAMATVLVDKTHVLNSINNGSLASNSAYQASQSLMNSANQFGNVPITSEAGRTKAKIYSEAVALAEDAIKQETEYLPESDKAVFNRRLNNNGVLSDSDKPLAKLSFISNRNSSSGSVSLEGDYFGRAQEVFAQLLQARFDSLTKTEKDSLAKELGSSGELNALSILALLESDPQKMASSEVMKLINFDRLIDDSVELETQPTPDGKKTSLANAYRNQLSQSFTDHVNNSILRDFSDNQALQSQLRSLFSSKKPFKEVANSLGALLVQYGYGSRVGDYLNRYRSEVMYSEWLNKYKSKAMSYDNNAAIMMPILKFDANSVNMARMIATNPKLADSIDSAINNATALSRQRDSLIQTSNSLTKG